MQVMFLLSQGAAAVQYTNAGELPVELVPLCCKPESQMGKARLKKVRGAHCNTTLVPMSQL